MRGCGQKVGGELEALKAGLNTRGHRFYRERFGQSGHALEQEMTVGEQAEQKAIDQIFLANHHVTNLLAQCRDPLPQLPYFLCNLLRRFHTV